MCFSCSVAPFPTPPPKHEDTRPGHNDAKEGGQVGQEYERNDDEGGNGHVVPIPRKGMFFWVKVNYVHTNTSLLSLAIPPSTPQTQKMRPTSAFFVFGWFVSTPQPLSPARHNNVRVTSW